MRSEGKRERNETRGEEKGSKERREESKKGKDINKNRKAEKETDGKGRGRGRGREGRGREGRGREGKGWKGMEWRREGKIFDIRREGKIFDIKIISTALGQVPPHKILILSISVSIYAVFVYLNGQVGNFKVVYSYGLYNFCILELASCEKQNIYTETLYKLGNAWDQLYAYCRFMPCSSEQASLNCILSTKYKINNNNQCFSIWSQTTKR